MRTILATSALFSFLLLPLGAARADCRASASGAFSAEVTLSPLAGRACANDVRVFAGASCAGAARWSVTLGCDETRRMIVTDRERLVSLRAVRASRREWEIVRVFEPAASELVVRSIRLDELPGLGPDVRRPRLTLDARELHALADPAVVVPVTTLETLGRARGRRALRRP